MAVGDRSQRAFARRVWTAAGIASLVAALAAVVVVLPTLPLMAFAALLGAVLLDGAAAPLRRQLRLPRAAAVLAVAAAGLGLFVAAVWLYGPRVAEQSSALMERLPSALNRLQEQLGETGWGRMLLSTAGDGWDVERLRSTLTRLWQPLAGAFATALAALSGALVVGIVSVFLALDPGSYRDGLLHLARPERRTHHAGVLDAMGRALRWWLVGRLASMGVVGLLTVIGLMLLGVPVALFLGVLTAILTFIPYLGPVLAAVPAVLVGLADGFELALWIVALYTGIQVLENNLLTPFIQERTVSLPPVVLILAQILMGGLFGLLGILVATPLTVVAIVAVQTYYVRDVLGDSVKLMGERGEERREPAPRQRVQHG